MKSAVKTIFSGLEISYMVKNYFFAIAVVLLAIYGGMNSFWGICWLILGCIFFPFAMVVYDTILSLLMGNSVIIVPFIFRIMWVLLKTILMVIAAPVIAPLGIVYIYLRSR